MIQNLLTFLRSLNKSGLDKPFECFVATVMISGQLAENYPIPKISWTELFEQNAVSLFVILFHQFNFLF